MNKAVVYKNDSIFSATKVGASVQSVRFPNSKNISRSISTLKGWLQNLRNQTKPFPVNVYISITLAFFHDA